VGQAKRRPTDTRNLPAQLSLRFHRSTNRKCRPCRHITSNATDFGSRPGESHLPQDASSRLIEADGGKLLRTPLRCVNASYLYAATTCAMSLAQSELAWSVRNASWQPISRQYQSHRFMHVNLRSQSLRPTYAISGRDVSVIIGPFAVLLKKTKRPFSVSVGAIRRSSSLNEFGVFGHLGDLEVLFEVESSRVGPAKRRPPDARDRPAQLSQRFHWSAKRKRRPSRHITSKMRTSDRDLVNQISRNASPD
jgi:hypothetical protein